MIIRGRFNGDTAAVNFDDTINVVVTGGGTPVISAVSGGSVGGVEHFTLDMLGHDTLGDTLDYTGTTQGVTVHLGTPSATGFDSIAGVENVDVVVETGAVTVTSTAPLDESAVRAAVEEAGYAVA